MDPRMIARAVGAGRVAVGAAFIARPSVALPWIGRAAQREDVGVALRAFGARDLVLGGLALHTASRPQVAARMAATGIVVDAVDLAATLAARRSVPATGVALIVLMAGGAIAGQALVIRGLRG
jgi:hypothetical protein